MKTVSKQVADHWSQVTYAGKVRWHQSPAILRHLNRLVCGEALPGPWAGLNRRLSQHPMAPFHRGISVGCGGARKELELLRLGIVKHFVLFEISETRLNHARQFADEMNLLNCITCHLSDEFLDHCGEYDLVYWNNALHHMLDTASVIKWSYDNLVHSGTFVMDDYVGPNRFQWSEYEMNMTRRVRELLPEDYLRHPRDRSVICPLVVNPPSIERMLATDPTEAADSQAIVPALYEIFPKIDILRTGGIVYHLALVDIIGNFNEQSDLPLLEALLLLDEEIARAGHTHYAVGIGQKL